MGETQHFLPRRRGVFSTCRAYIDGGDLPGDDDFGAPDESSWCVIDRALMPS